MIILSENSLFLQVPSDWQSIRQRRGAGLGLVALATVGLFGCGIAIISSISCGLFGTFGGFQGEAKANAESIGRLSGFTVFGGSFY